MKGLEMKTTIIILATILLASTIWSASLTWTAPGDDGDIGTAAEYDMRISTTPESLTEANWELTSRVQGLRLPRPAGHTESYQIVGLDSDSTYYFAIQTSDEAGNKSGISNIASVGCDTTDLMRYDLDCSGIVDISDLMNMIDYMFR